jgi:hypothetical protein
MRRSNPSFLYDIAMPRDGLLRGACHRARIRATRWLAMTIVLLFEIQIRSDRFFHIVMPGLDPGIHHLRKSMFRRRWIAGSSPAMTE